MTVKLTAVAIAIALVFLCAGASFAQDMQHDWRWCSKCQGLFFAAVPGSKCPAGGEHNATTSGRYSVPNGAFPQAGQTDWRFCSKCKGLFFSQAGKPSLCPAIGPHTASGGNYKMLQQAPSAFNAQAGWKWCKKCGTAFFGANAGSACPAGNGHDGSASGGYFVIEGAAASVGTNVQVADDFGFPFQKGESQSTVVPPGKKPQCPAGRVLFSADTFGDIVYRALNEAGDVVHKSTITGAPAAPADYNLFGTNDHDLVTLENGDVYYITGAHSKAPIAEPQPAWKGVAYRGSFGPAARTVVVVWKSTDCGKTFMYVPGLMFDTAEVGDRSCALPQHPRIFRHVAATTKYLVPTQAFADGETGWHYCGQCRQLFFSDSQQPTVCPAGGKHQSAGGIYKVSTSAPAGSAAQTVWKKCKLCATLFDPANSGSNCPARAEHDGSASSGYHLLYNEPPGLAAQDGWGYCLKCHGLVFSAGPGSCPRGGTHDRGPTNYQLTSSDSTLEGQAGWRWCNKCQGLFFAPGSANACPSGGKHDQAGSGNYKLRQQTQAGHNSQQDWKRCDECGLLFHAVETSSCPIVRPHDGTGSANYHLALDTGIADATQQADWRSCTKCQALFFFGPGETACPVGAPGQMPIYNMGGTDGQLAIVDPGTNRILMTHRCVGLLPDKHATGNFELSGTFVNKSFIAESENGAPWKVLGILGTNIWRTGIVRRGPEAMTFALGSSIFGATRSGTGPWTFNAAGVDVLPGTSWGFDGTLAPQNKMHTNVYASTVVARVPNADALLLAIPDEEGDKFGYRVVFHDPAPGAKPLEAAPIMPASGVAGDFVFHLQAVTVPDGPVLLYWNDVERATQKITVRGRFVTGFKKGTADFVISRSQGAPRTYSLAALPDATGYWIGDYHTAGAFSAGNRHIYFPMWIEPDGKARYGRVEITITPSLSPQLELPTKTLSQARVIQTKSVPPAPKYRGEQRPKRKQP